VKISDKVELIYGECNLVLPEIESKSIDIIMTDPPYGYTVCEWDKPFDEELVFGEFKRIVKDDGFVCIFGRGASFYRWGTILDRIGFTFKEEIVWNKVMSSSIVTALNRVHETCSIWSLKGKIRKSRIRFDQQEVPDYTSLKTHIATVENKLGNPKSLEMLRKFIESGELEHNNIRKEGFNVTIGGARKKMEDELISMRCLTDGMVEKSVITVTPDHTGMIHETQKPVRIIERIMLLCSDFNEGLVLDPFSGSGSTGIACIRQGRQFKGIEKDEKYFNLSAERLKKEVLENRSLF
jgi:site-specific DNA-methyltransferase (adenine-specific)